MNDFSWLEEGEETLPIPEFPNYYITNRGRVWNSKRKTFLKIHHLIKSDYNNYYYFVCLPPKKGNKSKTKMKIHTLVGRNFLDWEEGDLILHKEENLPFPEINYVENLMVGNHKKNTQQMLLKRRNSHLCKLSVEDVKEIKSLLSEGKLNNVKIGKIYNVSSQNIGFIRDGKKWDWVK